MLSGAAAEKTNGVLADAGLPVGAIASGKLLAIDLVAAHACFYWAAGLFDQNFQQTCCAD
jgi:hypothetical protein